MKNNIKKFFVGFAVTLAAVAGIGFAAPTKSEAASSKSETTYVVYESGYDYDYAVVYDNNGRPIYGEAVVYYL